MQAQINESDTIRFQTKTKASGNYQNGNVNVLTVKGNLEFTVKTSSRWVLKSQNAQLYQEFSDRKADNNIFSRNYLYFKPENKIYPFGIAYISTNFRRKIDLRYFVGAGMTYRPFSTVQYVVKVAFNIVYEESHFNGRLFNFSEYNGNDVIVVWRSSLYSAGWIHFLNEKFRVSYETFYQPAFSMADNYRVQLSLSLDCPVWKGLYMTTDFYYTHESVVPFGTREDDNILTFGVGYGFKAL